MSVRVRTSDLDRNTYQTYIAADGLYIQSKPPDDVAQVLDPINEKLERTYKQ